MSKRKKKTPRQAEPKTGSAKATQQELPQTGVPDAIEAEIRPEGDGSVPDSVRTFVSLFLFIHIFCVAVVLSGNFMPSQLQVDLASTVGAYTKTLHLDPNFVPLHFTDGEAAMMRLHQWQLLEPNSMTADVADSGNAGESIGNFSIAYRLPNAAMRGGFNHQRQDMFARVAGFYATNEALDDEVAASMAKSIAVHVHATNQLKSKRWIVRCVKYVDDADIQTEPAESVAYSVLYEANVWVTESGDVNLLKRIEPRRTAPAKSTGTEGGAI